MPEGIAVEVENGYASVTFLDPSLKGPALGRLLKTGHIDVDTSGRRTAYVVTEEQAKTAGLIDVPEPAAEPTARRKTPARKKAAPRRKAADDG